MAEHERFYAKPKRVRPKIVLVPTDEFLHESSPILSKRSQRSKKKKKVYCHVPVWPTKGVVSFDSFDSVALFINSSAREKIPWEKYVVLCNIHANDLLDRLETIVD